MTDKATISAPTPRPQGVKVTATSVTSRKVHHSLVELHVEGAVPVQATVHTGGGSQPAPKAVAAPVAAAAVDSNEKVLRLR